MTHSTARVATVHASRYLQQLCKHWAHKFDVAFDPHAGRIDFGEAECRLAADADGLAMTIAAPGQSLDRWEDVVLRHLERFAHREAPLECRWRRAA